MKQTTAIEPAAPKSTSKEENLTPQSGSTNQSEQEIRAEEPQNITSSGMNKTPTEDYESISRNGSETPPTTQAKSQREPTRRFKRSDGAELLYKPTPPASAQNPAFSPDGRAILFTIFHNGYNTGPAGLYRLDIESGKVEKIFDEPYQDAVNLPGSSWNKNGRITFASDREGSEAIWTVNIYGLDLKKATTPPSGKYHIEPSFSPEGSWITYEENNHLEETDKKGIIYKQRSDGGERKSLIDGSGKGYDDRQPNWSPKGDKIVFQRRMTGSDEWNLYTIGIDGEGMTRITDHGEDTDASWFSDGRKIVYSSTYGGLESSSIFTISTNGGEPNRITLQKSESDSAPSYSPDGQWIAFESHRADDEGSPAAIWMIRTLNKGNA